MKRIKIRVGQRTLSPDTLVITGATLTERGPNAVLDIPSGGGGGGGSSDHSTLTHLGWTVSGHTGTASRFAVFGSGGSAAYLDLPSTGLVAWTGTTWASTTIDSPLSLSGGHLSIDLSAYLTTAAAAAGYQPLDADLTALAGLGDGLPYRGGGTWGATALGDLAISGGSVQVSQARGLRESGGTTLTMGAVADGDFLVRVGTLISGLTSAILSAIASLSGSGFIVKTGSSTVAARTITSDNGLLTTNGTGASGNPLISLVTCTTNTDVDATSYHWWRIQTEGTSVVGSGVTGFSNTSGTVSLAVVASGYIGIAATITNNLSFYTVRSNSALYQTGFGGSNGSTAKMHYVSPTSTAGHRVWFALSTSLGTGSTPAANSCGLVYDPARSANWLVFSYDGTMQTSDTGVAYNTSTHYYLKLRTTATGVYGVVSTTASGLNGAETAVTSHLISSTVSQYVLFVAIRTAAGALSPVTFCGMDYTASYQ